MVYRGNELLGTVADDRLLDPEGQLLASLPPGPGPIRAPDGGELPFVLLEDGTLMLEGQPERASISEDGRLTYPGLSEEIPVFIDGVTEENRRLAMLLVLFQSGFLSDTFREAVQRAKAREALTNLRAIVEGLQRTVGAGDPAPDEVLGPTPAPGCDQRPWPADADPRWASLGFQPTTVRYSYLVQPEPGGLRLLAEGDLDCDGAKGRYELRVEIVDGTVQVEGEPTVTDPLE